MSGDQKESRTGRDPALAAFQTRLLNELDASDDAYAILQALQAAPESAEFAEFIGQMEPRMVEVAAELVKKWGIRGPVVEVDDR
jgi:hypothetical protein